MKTLQCIYDLEIAPCSYDFFAFLLSAETHRVRNRYDNIELIFLPGPNNGYREDNLRTDSQNEQFFLNVIHQQLATFFKSQDSLERIYNFFR